MPSFKLSAQFPPLDLAKFKRQLEARAREAMIKAARKFLLAAVPQVVVFTGFSRGAFGNLEDLVGQARDGPAGQRVDGRRGARKTAIKGRTNKTWYYYPPGGGRVIRNSITGKQFGTPTDKIISGGRLTSASKNGRVVFHFGVDISYFEEHANGKAAFEQGRLAFDTEIKAQFARIKLNPKDFIIKRTVV